MNRLFVSRLVLILICGFFGFFMAIILNQPPVWFVIINTLAGFLGAVLVDQLIIYLASRKGK